MEYTNSVRNRLRRIEGQIRGVLDMLDESRDCRDVVTQLTAIRGAVDKSIASIVASNLEHCIRRDMEAKGATDEAVREAIDLLVRSR